MIVVTLALSLSIGPVTDHRLSAPTEMTAALGELSTETPLARSLTLTSPDSVGYVGSSVELVLNVSGANCTLHAASGQVVRQVTLAFGDGTNSSTTAVPEPSCKNPPWFLAYTIQYAYHQAGTMIVTARVFWGDGSNLSSTPVLLSIRVSPDAATTILAGWLSGLALTGGVGALIGGSAWRSRPTKGALPP